MMKKRLEMRTIAAINILRGRLAGNALTSKERKVATKQLADLRLELAKLLVKNG